MGFLIPDYQMKKTRKPHIEQFKELFGYGHFRPYKKGYEVRVNDLDTAFEAASKLIKENKLNLTLSDKDIQLRSFVVAKMLKGA